MHSEMVRTSAGEKDTFREGRRSQYSNSVDCACCSCCLRLPSNPVGVGALSDASFEEEAELLLLSGFELVLKPPKLGRLAAYGLRMVVGRDALLGFMAALSPPGPFGLVWPSISIRFLAETPAQEQDVSKVLLSINHAELYVVDVIDSICCIIFNNVAFCS